MTLEAILLTPWTKQSRLGVGLQGIWRTVETAFQGSSYWRALALLDIMAWLAVWRTHEASHADAISAAVIEGAEPGALGSTPAVSPHLLHTAAVAAQHSFACYTQMAALGYCDSFQGFLQCCTVKQLVGRDALHRISAEQHLSAVCQLTGVAAEDVVSASWQSALHSPAYYVALDRRSQCIVVSVRGTVQIGDYLTVLDAAPEPVTLCGVTGHAHAGMLASAAAMLDHVLVALQEASRRQPGWPVLLTGHSLGGGVSALLTLMVEELRQRGDARVECVSHVHSISIGTAAATDRALGEACKGKVTSVVYGADALPMFSVRGARMLIDDIAESSRLAALVTRLASRRRHAEARLFRDVCAAVPTKPMHEPLERCDSAATHCGIVCGSRCSGLCGGRVLDSAVELTALGQDTADAEPAEPAEAAEAAADAVDGQGKAAPRHARCDSVASVSSDWTDVSSAASMAGSGEGGETMYPPGRLLWILPAVAKGAGGAANRGQSERHGPRRPHVPSGEGPHVVVEADQSLFQRFLLLPSTTVHHVPRTYLAALHGLLRAAGPPA